MFNSIRIKAAFGLMLLTLLLLVMGTNNYMALNKLQQNTQQFATVLMPGQGTVLNADRDLYQAFTAQQGFLLVQGKGDKANRYEQDFSENVQQAKERMEKFLQLMQSHPEVLGQLQDFPALFSRWQAGAENVFTLAKQQKLQEALVQQEATAANFATLREQYNLAGELSEKIADQLRVASEEMADHSQFWTVLILLGSVTIGLLLTYIGPKLIVDSIVAVHDKVDDISRGDGDLISRLPTHSQDELGKLARAFNRFLDQLQSLIRELLGDVKQLEESTTDLRQISGKVDHISESQRTQLASLVTAFNEINQSVHDISRNAQQTSDKTRLVQESATQGLQLLHQNVDMNEQLSTNMRDASAMVGHLANESEKITSVLDEIRGIAEQTNLLALNAAIEAARAGEQGRGFAVVADEVRTLATRTQGSTQDIQQMIAALKQGVQNTVQAMARGSSQMDATVEIVNKSRNALTEIQQRVSEVLSMNFQIAAATEQQGAVMDEMNGRVSELNSLTEESSALSVTVLTTGNDLGRLSSHLADRVRKFKV